ncbi:hypothetical protein U1Q18_017248 [Sarracenia purpurea var. burkii]
MKCSYKEILENGKKEDTEREENDIKEDNPNPIAIASERKAVKISEKGKKEGTEREENNIKEDNANPITIGSEREVKISKKDENGSNESIRKEDPILQLFDSSWNMRARE